MTRAERRRALREGQEVDLAEVADVNEPPAKKPFTVGMLGWNRHGAVRLWPLELNGANEVYFEKLSRMLEAMRKVTGVSDPSPVEMGRFLGENGGPLAPMETALAAMAGWAEMNNWKNLGEEVIGEMGVLTLATILRDILGGLFMGARSRAGENLAEEALEPMRQLPKSKRF